MLFHELDEAFLHLRIIDAKDLLLLFSELMTVVVLGFHHHWLVYLDYLVSVTKLDRRLQQLPATDVLEVYAPLHYCSWWHADMISCLANRHVRGQKIYNRHRFSQWYMGTLHKQSCCKLLLPLAAWTEKDEAHDWSGLPDLAESSNVYHMVCSMAPSSVAFCHEITSLQCRRSSLPMIAVSSKMSILKNE